RALRKCLRQAPLKLSLKSISLFKTPLFISSTLLFLSPLFLTPHFFAALFVSSTLLLAPLVFYPALLFSPSIITHRIFLQSNWRPIHLPRRATLLKRTKPAVNVRMPMTDAPIGPYPCQRSA
ncbi:hypothetical protein SDB63_24745, partial [Brucella sp. NBRC 113783]|uniref:hypothetical protein n=1 Tax=Brucella sp. NBRC 113783 TaxID=3075478 RepID=UPI0029BFAA25